MEFRAAVSALSDGVYHAARASNTTSFGWVFYVRDGQPFQVTARHAGCYRSHPADWNDWQQSDFEPTSQPFEAAEADARRSSNFHDVDNYYR